LIIKHIPIINNLKLLWHKAYTIDTIIDGKLYYNFIVKKQLINSHYYSYVTINLFLTTLYKNSIGAQPI